MSRFPAYIYDKHRPGITNETEAAIWSDNRERLERIIKGVVQELGAVVFIESGSEIETTETLGDALVVKLLRPEPPITAEEARDAGNRIVDAWQGVLLADPVPTYCDAVFKLPQED